MSRNTRQPICCGWHAHNNSSFVLARHRASCPPLPPIDLMSFSGRFAVEETNRIRPPHLCVACGIAPVRGISRKIACCISKYLGARGDALAITVNQAFENCNTLNKTNFVRFYFARISITNLTTTLRVRLLDD